MGEKGGKLTNQATEVCGQLVARLSGLGHINSKKMFGGHGIFENGKMFGLVNSHGEVFLKAGEANRAAFEQAGAKQHGKMPYFSVPSAVLENETELHKWAKAAIEIAHA